MNLKKMENEKPSKLHRLGDEGKGYLLRWQIGCIGCLFPILIFFFFLFLIFRFGWDPLGLG
ncbi:MAG: hypothetical protein FI688_00080 [SAR202 cluster bacterium]|nr:hypothetical protein [Chloroflexota bacterium]MQG21857.1 hypothetical protein [SAR202 cluster bacterium]